MELAFEGDLKKNVYYWLKNQLLLLLFVKNWKKKKLVTEGPQEDVRFKPK